MRLDYDPNSENKPRRRRGNEHWVNHILGSLAQTLGGGTSNINRNIIAERGLGLPRDV